MKKELCFEEYLDNVAQCLEKLSDDNIGLNESLELYKNGMEHLQKAQKMLENAQLQCQELKMQFTKDEE